MSHDGLHPQLQTIADEFHFATARLHALAKTLGDDRWRLRSDPDRWSPAECVAHLNLTGAAYAGILDEALTRARGHGSRVAGHERYRRDFRGWLLWKTMPPPVRFRVKTVAKFIPEAVAPKDALVAEFDKWQEVLLGALAAADGMPLSEIVVVSPFSAKVRYNLFSCLSMLPPHQHRHLWQAEQVWN